MRKAKVLCLLNNELEEGEPVVSNLAVEVTVLALCTSFKALASKFSVTNNGLTVLLLWIFIFTSSD